MNSTPGIPKPSLPSQYQVKIECNILDQKGTTTITENYDFPNDRGEITQVAQGSVFKGYFDYKTKEFISVLPGTCELCLKHA